MTYRGSFGWLYGLSGFMTRGNAQITTNMVETPLHSLVRLCIKESVHVDLFYISRKISHDVASGLYRGRKGDKIMGCPMEN